MTEISPKRNRNRLTSMVMWGADLLAIWVAVILLGRVFYLDPFDDRGRILLLAATLAYVPAWWYLRRASNLRRSLTLDMAFVDSLKALIIHGLVFASLAAFLHTEYRILFFVVFYGILVVIFPVINLTIRLIIKRRRRRGKHQSRVAIVGTNETSKRLAESMLKDPGLGYKIVGFFDTEPLPGFDGHYAGNFDLLEQYAREHRIDEIYFTLVGEKAEKMPRVVRIADSNVLDFFYVPKISRYVSGNFHLSKIGSVPVLTLRRNPLSLPINRGIKRAFDIVFSSAVLLLSPVIFLPVAIGIKLSSPGPVFFRQERTGHKGRSFLCYKFRTMKVNVDADKVQATEDDPRKTRFGNFLRHTNIDELPQFINVWLGDMSIVGPRPHMLKHTEDYAKLIDKYMVRHVVKPGITGWAQVNGYRGITDELWKMEKRVESDVWYIENWSFSLDLKIIVRTLINAVRGDKNAF